MSAFSQGKSGYAPPPGYDGVLPTWPAPPVGQQPGQVSARSSRVEPTSAPKSPKAVSDGNARLRKACDSCSIRKVKCDESGPPCRSCAALEIPCTFERPSRRRGPPNRHAEAIKRQRLQGSSEPATPTSPTHAAAQGLASLSTAQQLSAESICDLATLHLLIDDYFTYIHPLVPVPHEPTFRAAFARREDLTNRTFLALLAAMIGSLVASFPRKPLLHFKQAHHSQQLFPSSGALLDRCHKIVTSARGPGYLDNDLTVHDAAISYLTGLIAAYTYDMKRCRLYFGECIMILRILEVHKAHRVEPIGPPRSHASDQSPQDPTLEESTKEIDYVSQELGRRLFYICLVGYGTMQQLGSTDGELLMPPSIPAEPYPPLPLEVDDAYIFPTHIMPQPQGIVSELTGFNANVRVYRSYNSLTALDMAFGADEVFDLERQKRMIGQSLRNVKSALDGVPPELVLQHVRPFVESQHAQNQPQNPLSQYERTGDHWSGPSSGYEDDAAAERRRVQREIQKANIYASQLGTRSYLVEKFFHLSEAYGRIDSPLSKISSPGVMSAGLDRQLRPSSAAGLDMSEEAMSTERENIVKDLLVLLRTVSRVNMEPNGTSFTHKIRQIASTLLNVPRTRMGQLATKVEMYLGAFLDILMKLERLAPGESENGHVFTDEEMEERELSHWASLKEYQVKFAEAGGFLRDL